MTFSTEYAKIMISVSSSYRRLNRRQFFLRHAVVIIGRLRSIYGGADIATSLKWCVRVSVSVAELTVNSRSPIFVHAADDAVRRRRSRESTMLLVMKYEVRIMNLTVVVVANSLVGRGGAGRKSVGTGPGWTDGGRAAAAWRLQRQRGQRRYRDAEYAADRVSGRRRRRRADESGGRRRRQAARRLRRLLLSLTVMMVMVMVVLRRHRLLGLLGRLVTHNPAHTAHSAGNVYTPRNKYY